MCVYIYIYIYICSVSATMRLGFASFYLRTLFLEFRLGARGVGLEAGSWLSNQGFHYLYFCSATLSVCKVKSLDRLLSNHRLVVEASVQDVTLCYIATEEAGIAYVVRHCSTQSTRPATLCNAGVCGRRYHCRRAKHIYIYICILYYMYIIYIYTHISRY